MLIMKIYYLRRKNIVNILYLLLTIIYKWILFFSSPSKKLSNPELDMASKNEDYNLQLLAEVATKLPRITST